MIINTLNKRRVKNANYVNFYREQAADYIFNPVERDSRRGLKRSWQGTPVEDGGPGPSSQKNKPSSKEKGKLQTAYKIYLIIYVITLYLCLPP